MEAQFGAYPLGRPGLREFLAPQADDAPSSVVGQCAFPGESLSQGLFRDFQLCQGDFSGTTAVWTGKPLTELKS